MQVQAKILPASPELRRIAKHADAIDRAAAELIARREAETLAREIAEIAERKRIRYNEKRRAYHAANKDRINARRRHLRSAKKAKKAKLVTLF